MSGCEHGPEAHGPDGCRLCDCMADPGKIEIVMDDPLSRSKEPLILGPSRCALPTVERLAEIITDLDSVWGNGDSRSVPSLGIDFGSAEEWATAILAELRGDHEGSIAE